MISFQPWRTAKRDIWEIISLSLRFLVITDYSCSVYPAISLFYHTASEAGFKKEGKSPAWAVFLVHAAICGEGTATSRCSTISKQQRHKSLQAWVKAHHLEELLSKGVSFTSPPWPVGFLWGKGALKMNKQNKKNKADLSEGALRIPQGTCALPWPWLRAHPLPLPAPGSSLLYFVWWSLLGT